MLTFKVTLNKKESWVIGVPNRGVVSAEVHFARRINKKTRRKHEEILLTLGGLEEIGDNVHEFLTWATKSLATGDRIVIQVVSSEASDPVLERRREVR